MFQSSRDSWTFVQVAVTQLAGWIVEELSDENSLLTKALFWMPSANASVALVDV
jgi:hypothetical protein